MSLSTVRSAVDGTIDERPLDKRPTTLRHSIAAEWRQSGHADLVHALRQHPVLLRDKSQLLNLAIEEYRTNSRSSPDPDLEEHCHRFREFGSSIERSIFRQLEAQRYIDSHPELLELFSTPEWPKVGEQFGEFQVLEELGVGSAAHVYLCLQSEVGFRQVVVKATPFSSFEASILGRLSHQNIVRIYSTGTVDECNLNYLCMPFCGRSTLSDLLDVAFQKGCPRNDNSIAIAAKRWMCDGESSVEKPSHRWWTATRRQSYVDGILRIAIQIVDALQAAHERGILHGDLKPSNVLLTPESRPLLLDFNLSQDFVRSPVVCGGTLPYMPPEYLRVVARHAELKRDAEFNATPDVYSFGALLYELLTGLTPVNLENNAGGSSAAAELILAKLEHGVPSICQHNRFVSRKLESIVLRCLAFDSRNRPSQVGEIRQVLQSELRSFSAIHRNARLRPVFFASVVGFPLAVLAGAGAYVSVQPERYVVNYKEGLELVAAGRFDEASDCFASAARNNPSFAPARFQLARARLAVGDVELALNDFIRLATNDGDVHSMAYAGYCFNRKALPEAAIVWYERAIDKGAVSASIYNNLGASYIKAHPLPSRINQLRHAEYYLNKALIVDSASTTVQLNLVRRARAESQINPEYDPFKAWLNAWRILRSDPNDATVKQEVIGWYAVVVAREAISEKRAPISAEEQHARKVFAELIHAADFAHFDSVDTNAASNLTRDKSQSSSLANSYFIEPDSINIAR
jgi:eukaryotic-like serine/threonine-protein kinase